MFMFMQLTCKCLIDLPKYQKTISFDLFFDVFLFTFPNASIIIKEGHMAQQGIFNDFEANDYYYKKYKKN